MSALGRVLRACVVSLAALAVTASVAAAQDDASPRTLEALLGRFAAAPGFEASFVEEKRIALLAVPVRNEGHLYFAPPGRLLRRVERPDPSVALIANGSLRMRQGDHVEELSIDDNPVLRGFIDSFRAVLAGDREALARFYESDYTPDAEGGGWQLVLHPRGGALARFLREIRIRGRGVTVTEMRMTEVNGDETHTTFSDVNTARRFSPAEIRRIFRVD